MEKFNHIVLWAPTRVINFALNQLVPLLFQLKCLCFRFTKIRSMREKQPNKNAIKKHFIYKIINTKVILKQLILFYFCY